MSKAELEAEASRLGLIERNRTRDDWPHSWNHPTTHDLVIWRIKSGFQTAFLINHRFRDHREFPTLALAFERMERQ